MSQPPRPFLATGDTVNIDVSSSSQKVLVSAANGGVDVRIHNAGSAEVWFKFGVTTGLEASASTSMSIGAGAVEVLRAPNLGDDLYAAAIAAGATGKIYFTPGTGI